MIGWEEIIVEGIYHGRRKLNDVNQYFLPICQAFEIFRETGVMLDGRLFQIAIKGICCYAPASSFVKNIEAHSAYFGCRKCSTRGTWITNSIRSHSQGKSGGRVAYNEIDAPLRTDSSFRERSQLLHHNKYGRRSVIENILRDVIDDDIIDYMHLVCMGPHKKGIEQWISAICDKCRFSSEVIKNISFYLLGISSYITNLFPRTTRPLDELPRWKATELKLDLLHVSPVVYKPYLTPPRYDHLMLLHVAIKILVSKEMCQKYSAYAGFLLKTYCMYHSVCLYTAPNTSLLTSTILFIWPMMSNVMAVWMTQVLFLLKISWSKT